MTLRAAVIGAGLGLVLCATTYLNDWLIGQTLLLGNQLPISIFGTAIFILLAVNPLLRILRRGWALEGREILVVVAISLACFAWPGSSFYRWFIKLTALPAHWERTRPHWQSNAVMSYVPGASAEIAPGHVRDWQALVQLIARADRDPSPTPARRIWAEMSEESRHRFAHAASSNNGFATNPSLLRGLNAALKSRDLFSSAVLEGVDVDARSAALLARRQALEQHQIVQLNRQLLAAAYPHLILPAPEGGGWLVAHGRADERVVDTLVQGRSSNQRWSLTELPWSDWAPTLVLWGGLAMLLCVMAVSLALIVHPQWSKHELLTYPVVRFIEEATARATGGRWPAVFENKLFWVGFSALLAWHTINGVHAWIPESPEIPRSLDFNGLRTLFPNAARLWYSDAYFAPTLYLTVIAFAFFLPSQISFSLGVSQLLFIALGAMLLANGVSFEHDTMRPTGVTMLRFGSYLGAAAMIAYTGRRYYTRVAMSALGKASAETPRSAIWAARSLGVSGILAVAVMHQAGLSLVFAALFVAMAVLSFVVLARVVSETGAFHMNAGWLPVASTMGLFGFEALGPTTFIVLALASSLLFHDLREALMGALCNAFQMSERGAGVAPVRLVPWMGLVIVAGFFIAGAVTFHLSYNYGAIARDQWGGESFPTIPFDRFAYYLTEASAYGTLSDATARDVLGSLGRARLDPHTYGWLGLGFVAVILVAAARLRLPWWPLHPVIFLVWGTWEITNFAFSFLLGSMFKFATVHTAGARGYHAVKPLMVGIIAGELLSGLFWIVLGAGYFAVTNQPPSPYNIFPR